MPGQAGPDHARWVLCFVSDPDAVVREVTKALRPGGRFAVQDYVNYEAMLLSPPSEHFTRVIRVVAESWRRRGGDPNVCQRIPSMNDALRPDGREDQADCALGPP